jgi:hypothetical protein
VSFQLKVVEAGMCPANDGDLSLHLDQEHYWLASKGFYIILAIAKMTNGS